MAEQSDGRIAVRVLVIAMLGFLVNFWAWALISPLGNSYGEALGLTGVQQSVLVAVPVIVGSLGRIPVGALTDKFGSRRMFPTVTVLTILPVLFIGFVAETYAAMLVGGFFLGLGGTAFAIGVPAVNQWFAPERRGTALGLFGLGMGGTAISAFTTVRITDAYGPEAPFILVACVLAVYAVASALLLRDKPGRPVPTGSFLARTWATARIPATGQLSLLYALGFGGFVAFSVYLPTYLVNAYDLTAADAAARTAGFVVLAVAMRPVGGTLSDRVGPVPVLLAAFVVTGVLALVAALELPLIPLATIAFLGLAAALGAASGAVFALVAQVAPQDKVGAVTGIVGAAGGLGGFFPPLVMGAVFDLVGDYSLGYVLLAVSSLAVAWFTAGPVRRAARARADATATH
ncbi:nitrate/nitrite transporter [Cellulomonas sp. Root137]|uniref:MFS transporter n=1 Tax=Cellulomonas sp. Root137 TaxID=1736459 RepID=UPI000701E17D|nr:MFS transporter [Cellulomonas sp. Root137]KQY47040.1 MFS transporter [Cellulomonas sp. Root137]KRD44182.1 MFS transporter [Cellulomonas sp. Root930]